MNITSSDACIARRFRGTATSSAILLLPMVIDDSASRPCDPISYWAALLFEQLEAASIANILAVRNVILAYLEHIELITRSLNFSISEPTHTLVRFGVSAFAHVPSRRFRSEEYETAHDDGRKHRRGHHYPPIQAGNTWGVRDFVKRQVRSIADHDAWYQEVTN